MWQAISRLLSEQLGEGEIELRKPTNWSYCRVVKPSPCLRFGQ